MGYVLDFGAVLHGEYLGRLLSGVWITLALSTAGWTLAFVMGIVLVLIRMAPFKPFEWFVVAFVEYHQNVPLLVQILIWYFVIPQLLPLPAQQWINAHNSEFMLAVLALTFCYAAFNSEAFRSGLRGIPVTQYEAGRVLGFSHLQTLAYITVPQAIRNAVPILTNISLGLFKGSSIAMAIGVHELTYQAREIENYTFRTFEIFAIATLIYIFFSLVIVGAGSAIERSLGRAR